MHPEGQKHHLRQELLFLSVRKRRGKPDKADEHDCGWQQDRRQSQRGVLQVGESSDENQKFKVEQDKICTFWSACFVLMGFYILRGQIFF